MRTSVLLIVFALHAGLRAQSEAVAASPLYLHFPPPTAEDLDSGFITLDSQELDIRLLGLGQEDLKTTSISIRVRHSRFMPAHELDVRNLEWRLSTESDTRYRPLTVAPVIIPTRQHRFRLCFRLKVGWGVPPGPYYAEVVLAPEKRR